MARKKQDLKPDVVLKNYWRDNEKFADFFNAVLFGGEQVILPDELEERDTDESVITKHGRYAKSIEAYRDNINICKKSLAHEVELVILAIESQEYVHYAMPMRVMGYDYSRYKRQYDKNALKYKKPGDITHEEFVSKMKKTDKFIPVITVVVYYGVKPWDGALSLYGILDIPDDMKPFVNDYKMHLVEARENDLVFYNMDNIAFFDMMKIILDKNATGEKAKKELIEYAAEHQVDETVIMTVAGAANCAIDYNASTKKKGEAAMKNLFEKIAEDSKAEGRAEGRAEGIIEAATGLGLGENDIVQMLQNKLSVTRQKAQEYYKRLGKRTV